MAGMIAIAPSAAMAADMENGAQVFAGNCAACHAGGNNVIQNEKVFFLNNYDDGRKNRWWLTKYESHSSHYIASFLLIPIRPYARRLLKST